MAYSSRFDQAEAAHLHYVKNKQRIKARARIFTDETAKKRNREFLNTHLESHPCVDCGESDIVVLEFDHVRGVKKYNVSNMVASGHSLRKIRAEIDKCEIRCANCHRRVTAKRRLSAGYDQLVDGGAHNASAAGSIPAPATNFNLFKEPFAGLECSRDKGSGLVAGSATLS